jgi:hypothetical protein
MSHHSQCRGEKTEVPDDVMSPHWTKLKVQIQSYLPDSVENGAQQFSGRGSSAVEN